MKIRKLPQKESGMLRKKPFVMDKHVMMRELRHLRFRKVEEVFLQGEIFREGKRKYRSVLPVKGGKILYVVFEEHPDFLEFKTCGVAVRRKFWG